MAAETGIGDVLRRAADGHEPAIVDVRLGAAGANGPGLIPDD